MTIVKEFKGLFTNIDENDVSLEYLKKAHNVRVLPGRIKWDGKALKKVGEENVTGIQWAGYVYLEEDKNSNQLIDGILYKNYSVPQFIEFFIKIKTTNTELYVKLSDEEELGILVRDTGTDLIQVWNVINDDGTVKIFTDQGSYILQRIDRTLFNVGYHNYYLSKLILPFEKTSKYLNLGLSIEDNEDFALDSTECQIVISSRYTITDPEDLTYNMCDIKLVGNQTMYVPFIDNELLQRTPDVISLYRVRIGDRNTFSFGWCLPKIWNSYLNPKGKTWDQIKIADNPVFAFAAHECYVIDERTLLSTTFIFTGGRKVKDIGINKQYRFCELLATLITDNGDEYPIAYNEIDYRGTEDKYGIKVNIAFLNSINPRITAMAIYLKKYATTDGSENQPFEQTKFYNFNQGEQKDYKEFYISGISPNGILLSQTIGVDFNFDIYESVDRINEYLSIGNYAYAISEGKIHHSAVGSGKVLFHTFHKNQFIPIAYPNSLFYSGNYAIVNTDSNMTIIKQTQESGIVLFNIDETYPYIVNGKLSAANFKDVLIIHTVTGIFLLQNGKEPVMISNPINDIIELNYETGLIAVDETHEILYYLPKFDSTILYCYKFIDGTWSTIDIEGSMDIIKHISWKDDGIVFITTEGKVFAVINDSSKVGEITSHKSFLGESNYHKVLNRFEIDFVGTIVFNDIIYIHTYRSNLNVAIPLNQRIPFEKLNYSILIHPGTEIYQITLDVEALMKVRF